AICRDLVGVRVTHLATERAVAAAHVRRLAKDGPVRTLVVANPADGRPGFGGMSDLAPYVALGRKAALVLTGPTGKDAEEAVRAAVRRRELRQADALVFVAGLKAVPMKERPNPVPGDKDKVIEMEPCTPAPGEPFTFATGRLFHDDLHVVALQLARQRLLAGSRGPRKALVASNAGGSLPLLETFSRSTVQELRNAGYETRALVGKDVTEDDLRRLLPEHDVFLWEGHHNTLIKDWKFPEWTEPLPPALIFLQSCLALMDWKALPALERGAVGVVGSSTRTYSASGGACSLAFFNALLYEDASLGDALRQSKNFLTAYAQLKEKRLGKGAKRGGANLRAAWAFTLWGDPTLKLPRPEQPDGAVPPVEHEVRGNTIVVSLPGDRLDKVRSAKYQAQVPANGRLAGLVRKTGEKDVNPLVPLVFTEVRLPKAPPGRTPKLRTRLPESNWVFLWDARRRTGYLLATPRARDTGELRFRVEWQPVETVGAPRPADGGGE
ncbi:MAG TPA: C25 family cysteine peptidase, partial [Gemmataceae bacterium]|nr:C25 family cysteine peptidase [Gemmataceae bacterium]